MAKDMTSLDNNTRDLLAASLSWADRFWDEAMGLLWSPGNIADLDHPDASGSHTVRDSAWYALGLLLRNAPGDTERAIRIVDTVLRYQFDEPGQPYHGTFYRTPEEPHPPLAAVEWQHYDPNWREFIMTTIDIILSEYEKRLPAPLLQKIDAAMARAVEGALARRLNAGYTNIALMNAYMMCFAGRRLGHPVWVEAGERMAREIYGLFERYHAFEEYNSPTYYGVDAYALALWRAYEVSPVLRDLGSDMERLLWADIARYYHAELRNICGPWDRSYGMDMRRYVAVIGEWIWLITGKDRAPLPDLDRPFAHAHDFLFAPLVAILGAMVPAEARAHFAAFQGERAVEQVISDSPRRVATAWLSKTLMLGAEHTSGARWGSSQFHPLTVHWRVGPDDVGWIRLRHREPVDVHAGANRLDVTGRGELIFQVSAAGARTEMIQPGLWRLPGLTAHITTDAQAMVRSMEEYIEIRYPADAGRTVEMTLETEG